jgi:two-component sensor histidine kinase
VEWIQDKERHIRIRWSETGGPAVKEPSHHGLGIGTIVSCCHNEFGSGQVSFNWHPEGLVCDLIVAGETAKV